jgi:hypothetical protein
VTDFGWAGMAGGRHEPQALDGVCGAGEGGKEGGKKKRVGKSLPGCSSAAQCSRA